MTPDPIRERLDELDRHELRPAWVWQPGDRGTRADKFCHTVGCYEPWPCSDKRKANALRAVLDVHDPDEVGMCNGCWWESKDVDNQTPMADCEVRKAIATALGVET